ncbi:MAG: hypothetical protein G01um101438_531 [Parcubacteria group bacterium Gr01-1014_38]|nr:MAG: hypothetical protein G01um101438_531 [Parcubacteria group bacterium Gr01-1014_38]
MRRTVAATLLTVGGGLLAFFSSDQFPSREYVLNFSDERDLAVLTSIQGIPFSVSDGHVTVTEPLAQLRLPFGKTVLGKRLVFRARFRADAAAEVAIGVKKGTFWLDYERQSLFAAGSEERGANADWIEGERQFDLSPAYLAPDGSLELMFFVKYAEEQPRLVLDELRLRVESSAPNLRTLVHRVRSQAARLIRRPPVTSLIPVP